MWKAKLICDLPYSGLACSAGTILEIKEICRKGIHFDAIYEDDNKSHFKETGTYLFAPRHSFVGIGWDVDFLSELAKHYWVTPEQCIPAHAEFLRIKEKEDV